MDTQQLQDSVARFFPDDYAPDTWKELLPRFIARHIEIYEERTQAYLLTVPDCASDDPRMQPPDYPVMPEEFAQACTLLATERGFTFEALAVCLFSNKDRIDHYKQKSESLGELCHEYDKASMELCQTNRELHQTILWFQAGTAFGKWLN